MMYIFLFNKLIFFKQFTVLQCVAGEQECN